MFLTAFAAALLTCASPAPLPDNLWLEDIDGPRSMEWVKAENAKSLPVLQGDRRYQLLHDNALAILSATDRIPAPDFIGEAVFNFWQDREHVRGVWRRATLASYRTGKPTWETVIDLDALAKAEKANWIWKGAECRAPAYDRCLVELSNGGKDAVEIREFDLKTKSFVAGGFKLTESKQTVAWLDPDTLILTRDWGPGTLTESGYGYIVKTLKRGQALSDAKEVFRGDPKDVSAQPNVLRDGEGRQVVLLERGVDFFHTRYWQLTDKGTVELALPQKSNIQGLLHGRIILTTGEDWKYSGADIKAGSLAAADPALLVPPSGDEIVISNAVPVIFTPGPRQSIDQVKVTRGRVVAVVYDNVRGRIFSFADRGEWGWPQTALPAADNSSINLASASDRDDQVFYSVESFLVPTELNLADAASAKAEVAFRMPGRFNADGLMVEQFQAKSKDGTLVPYFVVHRKDIKYDGSSPSLLFAYGGFQLSKLPLYDPLVGKLWLERGGVFIVANIRGGGEFGPAWHEAALKENRQRAYDDFFAVAEDAIARKITSPRRLGAYGRSNGGLLMGVALTERPDLWNAVVVESPLLDMLRYNHLSAGASWVGEYGDPDVPAEAAWIAKYSPMQNLKPGVKYPLAYITTSTKDDRVHPSHARRFAARLGEMGDPYLYFENTDGGHANGADPEANARRWAMHYVYLTRQLMD
ncbi:prolyl oligopeptidase [Caulobacter ginsengisoli]|uniref:Prolyl oligopeptidase n=1 Tax=Caulobacter ginsengisoli TaxID=400775 RepID=A0ABU0ITV5_9CAUL|nr:prolyl oligopeptidase family serine peptidase [Caulobacter ginsengisoli]MDQ0465424.1 prolyl oligopeptidase [Caulobacter ginsengisoli]